MESKIAVLGNPDFVMPFSALGLDIFATGESSKEITESATMVAEGKYGLVVVAENIAETVEPVFAEQLNKPTPCIVTVPFTAEPTGVAVKSLGESIRLATGINILESK